MNPGSGGGEVGSWDVVLLEDLNEDNLISNLSQRYKWDQVYVMTSGISYPDSCVYHFKTGTLSLFLQTYVGTYLIFLNPHKRLVLSSNDAIKLYAQRSLFKLPPHV